MSQSWARALACCASQQLGKTNEAAIALRVIVAGAVCVCARARAQARQPQKKICQNTEKRPIAATPRASTYRCLQHANDSRVLAGSDTIIGLAVTLRERSRAAPAQRAQGPRRGRCRIRRGRPPAERVSRTRMTWARGCRTLSDMHRTLPRSRARMPVRAGRDLSSVS